jgi:hypothetical protein
MDNQSLAPVPKVLAATAGSGLGGGALGTLAVWALQQAGIEVSTEVAIAIASLCGTVATFVAGYLTPPRA